MLQLQQIIKYIKAFFKKKENLLPHGHLPVKYTLRLVLVYITVK